MYRNHQKTLATRTSICRTKPQKPSRTYSEQDRYSEAKSLYIHALNICQRQLGVGHPNTVTVRKNLANLRVGVRAASRREARRRHHFTSEQ
ncbi:tetratricopeptide repeat protein [Nostoc sp. PA-18-2419]|uniref:tetratricopeptide repeat protein n=1 Tax=Nostoc sp. PA-18-2419 TaxID=2575443 RepID=UPI001CB92E87|nr:tetratricopeptide repeat protein [Nostoc sp. PA-18-2419]